MNKSLFLILLNKLKNEKGGGVEPTGTIEITENGTYDVTDYASADVSINTGTTIKNDGTSYLSYSGFSNYITEINNLDLSNFDGKQEMFAHFRKLTKISFSALPITATGFISGFEDCPSLVDFPFSTNDCSHFVSFEKAFKSCTNLANVPVLNTSNFGIFGLNNTFQSCSALTNESLNNILETCKNTTNAYTKTLKFVGLSSSQASTCQGLSNWDAFVTAGWSTGY